LSALVAQDCHSATLLQFLPPPFLRSSSLRCRALKPALRFSSVTLTVRHIFVSRISGSAVYDYRIILSLYSTSTGQIALVQYTEEVSRFRRALEDIRQLRAEEHFGLSSATHGPTSAPLTSLRMGFNGEGGALAFLDCCDATIQIPRGALKIRPRLGLLEQPIRDLVSTKQFPIYERVEAKVVSMRGSFSYSLIQFFW